MNIFLVRHAQSQANVDHTILHSTPNMNVELTNLGIEQAKEAGEFFLNELDAHGGIKVWNSPYKRTRQTAQLIKEQFKGQKIIATEESIYLAERQFGLIDNIQAYNQEYPNEMNHFNLHKEVGQEYFVRPPLGESPFDMCLRLDYFLHSILPNSVENNHIIVTHGAAIRGFIMMSQKYDYEWYSSKSNPLNASVHAIVEGVYKGEFFSPTEKTR